MTWDNMISRGLWAILQPSNLLIILLITGFIVEKFSPYSRIHKVFKKITPLTLLALVLIGFTNLSSWVLWPLEAQFEKYNELNPPYAGIIVLSGSERTAISTSHNLVTLNNGAERLIETAKLARLYPDIPIIHSGGVRKAANELSENEVAALFFKQAGINPSRIRYDDKSYNTRSNAVESEKLIKPSERHLKWLLVTSAFHMPRSVATFQKTTINFQPYPVDFRSTLKYEGLFKFKGADNFKRFDIAIHEYIGLVAYYLTGRSSSLFPKINENIIQ